MFVHVTATNIGLQAVRRNGGLFTIPLDIEQSDKQQKGSSRRKDVNIKKKELTQEEIDEMFAFNVLIFRDDDQLQRFLGDVVELYEDSGNYFDPIMDFRDDFNSLYRYWLLIKKQMKDHNKNTIEQFNNYTGPYKAERHVFFCETEGGDIRKFPEFLMSSVITFEISILETLLLKFSEEIAKTRGIPLDIEERSNRSFLDKYLYWLRARAGFEIDYDPEVYRAVDAVRMVRNSFIHKLGNDIPEKAKKIIREMLQGQTDQNIEVNEEFVEASFKNIAEFVKQAEDAYFEDWKKRNDISD